MEQSSHIYSKKIVFENEYIHVSQVSSLSETDRKAIETAVQISTVDDDRFNVVKISSDRKRITLLNYENFFEEGFPSLREYWTIKLDENQSEYRSYTNSLNPPILHRKELLLAPTHELRESFEQLTKSAEEIGLFENPRGIGFKRHWEDLLQKSGYQVKNNKLVPLANIDEPVDDDVYEIREKEIARHKTALIRYGFSAPIQSLARFGFLDGTRTIFDYGCGRGDDLRGLKENNITANGWDPYFLPEPELIEADIVNLGFVINVIEDIAERNEALEKAFSLCKEFLVVSAMLASEDKVFGKPYGDGYLTQRGTFQKYFSQFSLKQYIEVTLNTEAIPVSPGVFYIFKDKLKEQAYLYNRQKSRRNLLRTSALIRSRKTTKEKRIEKYEQHKDLLEPLWLQMIDLGREPFSEEVEMEQKVKETFGSLKKAVRFIKVYKEDDLEILEMNKNIRINDLRVFMAKLYFEKKKPYRQLGGVLKRDIKTFFGDYKEAKTQGIELLQNITDPEKIFHAVTETISQGLGYQDQEEALYVHTDLISQLPALLRTYINCGTVIYGEIEEADIVKIHIRSGKLSLLFFKEFNEPFPILSKRIKINLKDQTFHEFDHLIDGELQFLCKKSKFINEEYEGYEDQLYLEDELERLDISLDSNYATKDFNELLTNLVQRRYTIHEGKLTRCTTTPSPNTKCGKLFTFNDFFICSDTQQREQLENYPKNPQTYNAIADLCREVLEPTIDYFGMIKLTYGFCSRELSKRIPKGIAPKLDQHCGYELNRLKKPICTRLGIAADFIVEEENMLEVALWIAKNLEFDRLYFYGLDRPIHVSIGPQNTRQVTLMQRSETGKLIPKTFSKLEKFISFAKNKI